LSNISKQASIKASETRENAGNMEKAVAASSNCLSRKTERRRLGIGTESYNQGQDLFGNR
jgi:hypothetical protein